MSNNQNYSIYSSFYDRLNKDRMLSFAKKLNLFIKKNTHMKINSILDIGCGSGMILNFLNEKIQPKGKILGIDLSLDMINVAKLKYPNIKWEVQNISDLNINFYPDLIICTNDVINYLKPNEQNNFLKSIQTIMSNNSFFYLDFDTEKDIKEIWDGQINRIIGKDFELIITSKYDKVKCIGIETQKWIFEKNGKVFKKNEVHQLYPIAPNFLQKQAVQYNLFIENFLDPINMSKIENSIDLDNYLRLGCTLWKK